MKIEDLPPRYQNQAAIKLAAQVKPAAPNKLHAVRCQDAQGRWYASKLERKVAGDLKAAHGAQNVIEQVSFPVGDLRIRPDFMVFLERFDDGSFRAKLYDAKGHATDAWKAKANHLLDAHGIPITLVKK